MTDRYSSLKNYPIQFCFNPNNTSIDEPKTFKPHTGIFPSTNSTYKS